MFACGWWGRAGFSAKGGLEQLIGVSGFGGGGASLGLFEECEIEPFDEDGMLGVTAQVTSLFLDLHSFV